MESTGYASLEYFRIASQLTWQRENAMALDDDLLERLATLREQIRPYFHD